MLNPKIRAKILESKFLTIIVFPYRIRLIVVHLYKASRKSLIWIFKSKEFANFTYDLSPRNKLYLGWFISNICQTSVSEILNYFDELETNSELKSFIFERLQSHRRGNEIDNMAYFGRRIGWYALVRVLKPNVVVETGTEKGLGSIVIAEALIKNGNGQLFTIDIEPTSGLLIGDRYKGIITQITGDSIESLSAINHIDFFIHDSDHSAVHEGREFSVVETNLSEIAVILSDNSHITDELAKWSLRIGRKFFYFAEEPIDHWYPGAGIGISIPN